MGKDKKATIKFQKTKLKGVVKRRKDVKKFKKQIQNRQIRRGAPKEEKEEEKSIKTELAEDIKEDSAPTVSVEDYFCNFVIDAEESLDLSDDEEEDCDALDEFDANTHPKVAAVEKKEEEVEEEEEEEGSEEDEDMDDEYEEEEMEEEEESEIEEEEESEMEEESEIEEEDNKATPVTPALFKEWLSEVNEKSPKAWKKMLLAFRSIVRSDEDKECTYYVHNSKVYTHIVKETLKAAYPILSQHIYFLKKEKYPGRTKNWPKLEKAVRLFLNNCIRFLRDLSEDTMIQYVLEQLSPCTLYFGCFPKISREYLRVLLDRWSDVSLSEETRHACFQALSKLATDSIDVHRKNYLPQVLKGVYLTYAHKATSKNETNMAVIEQMKKEGADIYRLDNTLGYEHASVYVRQLVDRLKEAKKSHTVESFKMIYTWQYINCLDFWMHILSTSCDVADTPTPMHDLIHPLVNVCLYTIRLNPTAQFLPLRIHLLRTLISFMAATGFYVPLAPFLFEILASDLFRNHLHTGEDVHVNWDLKLKIPKTYLNTKEYQSSVFDIMKECFIDFYDAVGASMAFPELVVPAIDKLKEYNTKMKGTRFSKHIRSLIDKLERHKNYVEQKRAPMLQASDHLFK